MTGYNAKNVVDNNLGVGAVVEIIRSGDVIPKIINVIKPGKVELPKGKWSWNDTKVDIIMDNTNNIAILKKNVYFFFSTLETKGLGEKVIDKLYDAGFNTVAKILGLTEKQLNDANIDTFKEKTINNIINAIKKSTNGVTLAQIMTASNKLGHGMGIERMKQIITNIPNILECKDMMEKELINSIKVIDMWDTKTATLFVSNFHEFLDFYHSIKKYIQFKSIPKEGKLKDMIFVFSSFRDKELQNDIESQGGKVMSSVTKNTNFLIVKDNDALTLNTGKIAKARELGIKILTRDQFINKK